MKYEAIYNTQAAVDAAISQIDAWENENYSYYAMYGGGGLRTDIPIARCRNASKSGWWEQPAELPITHDSLRGHWAGWITCKGNYLQYTFPVEGGVIVLAEGRRHGIRRSPLAEMEPDKIMVYETLSPSQPWSAIGVEAELPIPPDWQEIKCHTDGIEFKQWLELCDKITHPVFASIEDDYYDLERMRQYIASAKLEPGATISLDERLSPMGIYTYRISHPEIGHVSIVWDGEKNTISASGRINNTAMLEHGDNPASHYFCGWSDKVDDRARAAIDIQAPDRSDTWTKRVLSPVS